ncbi:MAG: 2-oxoglutarate oxidoreductase subunit KorA [candidate division WS6 bacterium OLB20]|uniref:2-oxoglutarate oxidoreductase subunit KorA n=1 Tax=candidate division WS6 bacterium OLB20 TaxID=1617426 RepID=A0A136LXY2_9BACT|nr:MAG: 2-oxoglutarate oxidoreductase subunit KorA [candidate division WS6 bacterium OLB20]
MKDRVVIKVAGAAGQGIKTAGLVLAKALKRAGYASFGYTEYPSLIRGGHNVFQVEISTQKISSVSQHLNILLALNEESVKLHRNELVEGGVILFDEGTFKVSEELAAQVKESNLNMIGLPLLQLAKDSGGTAIMKNTVSLGAVWKVFGLDLAILQDLIAELFNKSEEIVATNRKCAEAGYNHVSDEAASSTKLPKSDSQYADDLIIGGNEALGLGAIAAGVRLYSSYPMTPASSILSYLAKEGTRYGMVVKQAEDEITAANMVIGASVAGTRAMCATSGGGFDLMTEAVSLAGITETPFVVVLGQRPGPATGVPTWTAQGDLNLALHGGHGEFPRIVLAAGDPQEAYRLIQIAHNYADLYQTPVILLTDKYLAESYFCVDNLTGEPVPVDRGRLVTGEEAADRAEAMRYAITDDGISERWLPGSQGNTYLANSDEHTEKGYSTEEANEITAMMAKRLRKGDTIAAAVPEPDVFGEQDQPELLIISWGSNKTLILDAMEEFPDRKISYVHYTHMWPLKTERVRKLIDAAEYVFSLEVNATGQFTQLLSTQTGIQILDRKLKYDGRPFYIEELRTFISEALAHH